MTAHSALQALQDVIAEEATLQAEIDKINAALNHHQSTINTIGATQAAAAHEVEAATKRLSAALIDAGEGGESDPLVAQARTGLQAAIKAKDRAEAKATEVEAHKQALATLSERARPMADRLMQIAQLKSEAAEQRVREYAAELAAEQRALAQQFAELYAKARALSLIALSANMNDRFAPLDGRPPVLVLDGIGKLEQVVVPYGDDVRGQREAYIQRLSVDGFNLIGAA